MARSGPQEVPEDKLEELLKELKKIYYNEVREYRRCLNIVAQDLAHVLAQEAVRHLPIAARVKAWDSICGTAKRRQRDRLTAQAIRDKMVEQGEDWEEHFKWYNMSTTDLGHFRSRDELQGAFHDMLGARIILYFPSDAGRVLKLLDAAGYVCDKETKRMGGLEDPGRLRKLYEKRLDASASPGARPAAGLNLHDSGKQFSGYGAIHMVVRVPERLRPRDLEPEAKAIWERCVVEIQAGTIMMHAWAEVEHDIIYKSHGREVSQDEAGILDMLNGLALASEVGMRRFRSPPVSESPATDLEEDVRSWLHQFYIKKMCSTPSNWVDVGLLRDFLVEHEKNRRDEFFPLAEAACSTLREAEDRAGFKLDHLLPYVIIHRRMPTSSDECPPPPPPPPSNAPQFCAECSGPLRLSAEEARPPTVKSGTGKEAQDQYGRALLLAAENGGEAAAELLLKAAKEGREDVVRLLLDTDGGVDIDFKDTAGRTPLSWAAEKGHEAVVKLLLNTGKVDVDSKVSTGQTPLMWAAEFGHAAVVKLLLDTGRVDVNSKDSWGQTPLACGAQQGSQAVVKLLLDAGKVDVESKDRMGQTPLSHAAENGNEAVVNLLLDTGKVDVVSKSTMRRTPLSYAAQDGNEAVVKLLLAASKFEIDSKDITGRTPLLYAALNGREGVVKVLLDTGKVDADSKDDYGRTPLSRAAERWHEATVKLLLNTDGVDVNSKDDSGRTPLSWAAEHETIEELLRGHGATL
ncbi:hypothetical protein MAPG_01904 [Magnaporthiopsis poae ATCC 64411]|uniref:RelA/SpoT domain-containing protein n=1 Tax=Magnaporthiopsis poae (strain ATCC 64411 / 73-15) TaxID=644358 RepID=A0A0C4DPX4_MAGP6|nr:hypothetical protein MAPG_01904 [Magnaporthiopsis poae ATCC 64411]